MHPFVEQAWPTMARHHEGVYHWPYLDHTGLVTVGVGLLLEVNHRATEECFHLPWTVDGQPASRAQVASGWETVKARTELSGEAWEFGDVSRLRLDDQAINAALMVKTRQFWSELSSQLVDLAEWPADGQLALLDMAYQLGPWFMELTAADGSWKWPNFRAGAHASDFGRCALHCSVKQASTERNLHRRRLFQNAAQVEEFDIDPSRLWDDQPPEEDPMALTEEQISAIVRAELAKLKIPTAADIAKAVLDSSASDVIPVAGKRGNLWLKNAIGEIHTAVGGKPQQGTGTAAHQP